MGVDWFVDPTGRTWNGYSWQYRKKIDINHSKVAATSFSDGFESGGFSNWNWGAVVTTPSTLTDQTSTVKTGTYAAKVALSGQEAYIGDDFGSTMNASYQADITSRVYQMALMLYGSRERTTLL